ncbi:MAG: hypothetical protein WC517_04330 [Patescibacteria group bacterium]
MQLHLGKHDGNEATALIRWCLSPAEIAALKKHSNVTMVISVVDDSGNEERRYFVPVTEMAAMVAFRKPGLHRIYAGGVWDGMVARLARIYQRHRGYNNYSESILFNDELGGGYSYSLAIFNSEDYKSTIKIQAELEIEVDAGFYAGEPFDYDYVNAIFRNPPIDQCEHRKRRFIAHPIMPLALLLNYLIFSLAAVITVVLGMRKWMNWRFFRHPLDYFGQCPVNDRPGESYSSFFAYAPYKNKPAWRIALNWRLLIVYCGIGWLVWNFWAMINFSLVGILALIAAAVVGVLFIVTLFDLYLKPWVSNKINQAIKDVHDQDLDRLDCSLVPENVTYDNLERKSLRLRFNGIKAKVCRPFAGN